MLSAANPTAWDAAVNQSHVAIVKYELRASDGTLIQNLYPLDGSVSVDYFASTTRSLSLSLYDDGTLIPINSNDRLSPFSTNEIWAYRGIRYSDGTNDYIKLGQFRISSLRVTYGSEAIKLDLSAYDRSVVFAAAKYTSAINVAYSSPLITSSPSDTKTSASALLCQQVRSTIGMNFNEVYDSTVGVYYTYASGSKILGYSESASPWDDLQELAKACGAWASFNVDGDLKVSNIPNMDAAAPLLTFSAGTDSVLVDAEREFSTDGFCNAIRFVGASTLGTTPVTVLYSPEPDTSPFSPSKIGTRALQDGSSWITTTTTPTDAQARVAAAGIYQLNRGYDVKVSIVPNPRIDVLDVVRVVQPAIGLDSIGLVTRIDIPLNVDSLQTMTVRVRGY